MTITRIALTVGAAILLSSCGGGGGSGPAGAGTPAAPTLSLGFGVKELRFSWSAFSGADYYRLLENPDGVSGYTQVGGNLTALSYNHTIPVHRRLNASYVVEACNSGGCIASAPQILGTNLAQAIGYVKASNTGADYHLGVALALSGDGNTLAVGAPGEPVEGAVYVYSHSAGTWTQQAYVKASNSGAFGWSVALSGDGNTLAVGAQGENSSTTGINSTPDQLAPGAGAAYVFTRSGSTWSQQAYVKASNTGTNDAFGYSVALSGDGNTLAVGAIFEASSTTGINSTPNELAAEAGAAYVFTRSAGTWSQQAYVKASNTGVGHDFGQSVALSGDGSTLAVGAPGETTGGYRTGAVYVFTSTAGTWSQQAYVKGSNTAGSDAFGISVALSGDGNTLAVGAWGEDSKSTGVNSIPNELGGDAGAAYVFTRSAGAWSQQAYVKASNTGAGDGFGLSVALSGDGNTLAVGAPAESSSFIGIDGAPSDSDGATQAGAAYIFSRSASAWSQQAYVKASNTEANDWFGWSVTLSGDGNALAVGAWREDSSTTGIDSTPNELATDAGAVYLY